MARPEQVRAAIDKTRGGEGIVHFTEDRASVSRIEVRYQDNVPLSADRLIRNDRFLISTDSCTAPRVTLFA